MDSLGGLFSMSDRFENTINYAVQDAFNNLWVITLGANERNPVEYVVHSLFEGPVNKSQPTLWKRGVDVYTRNFRRGSPLPSSSSHIIIIILQHTTTQESQQNKMWQIINNKK